jgi:SNF2 family DNA or RNA helicase
VWDKLYKFQRDGVLGAIDKIEKYNGCVIADSVGLGKTFEALAIIKYYELRNDRVLVLCPKKIRENWTIFTINDKRNLFAADRFNYDVLNHTDLTRLRGHSGELNLETLNWGNYDLVVIDESHNFRNNPPRKDGMTRYSRLMRDIIKSGVKTKVLMLSATPVNNRMNDLKNQVSTLPECHWRTDASGIGTETDGDGMSEVLKGVTVDTVKLSLAHTASPTPNGHL